MSSPVDLSPSQLRSLIPTLALGMTVALTIDLYAAMPSVLHGLWSIPLSQAGLFTLFATLGWAVGQFFAGNSFARSPRLFALVAILGSVALSTIALSAPNAGTAFGMRVLAGAFGGIGFAGSRLILRSVARDETLGRLMSINNVVFLSGLAGAPVVGALLASQVGLWSVCLLHGAVALGAVVSVALIPARLEVDLGRQPTGGAHAPIGLLPSLAALTASTFFVGYGMAMAAPAIAGAGGSDILAGVLFIAATLGQTVAQATNGRLLRRTALLPLAQRGWLLGVGALAASITFWLMGWDIPAIACAMVVARSILTTAGTNIETIALSHPATSVSALMRRRSAAISIATLLGLTIPLSLGSAGPVALYLLPMAAAGSVGLFILLMPWAQERSGPSSSLSLRAENSP